MLPRKKTARPRGVHIAPRTNPESRDWRSRVNKCVLPDKQFDTPMAPAPATITWTKTTPYAKSGTLIGDDGNGGRERAMSAMRSKRDT